MSKIEWTEKTWNFLAGCTKVSAGCKNCYAIKDATRLAGNPNEKIRAKYLPTVANMNWTGEVTFSEETLLKPLSVKKPTLYFVNSMSDLFHENVKDEWIDRAFAVMALCPQHTFQVLTKRADRMRDYFKDVETNPTAHAGWTHRPRVYFINGKIDTFLAQSNRLHERNNFIRSDFPLPNVWLGVSVENQQAAEMRIPYLLQTPAAVRFLSGEPLLEEINFWICKDSRNPLGINCLAQIPDASTIWHNKIDWVIVGGESGAKARPCSIDWIRSIVRQCQSANVPVFVKQLGSVPMIYEADWESDCRKKLLNPNNRAKVAEGYLPLYQSSRKGGDINEFPSDLRVREMPV